MDNIPPHLPSATLSLTGPLRLASFLLASHFSLQVCSWKLQPVLHELPPAFLRDLAAHRHSCISLH